MSNLHEAGPAEIADAIAMQSGAWTLVIFPEERMVEGIARICSEIEFLAEEDDEEIIIRTLDAAALIGSENGLIQGGPHDVTIVEGIERLSFSEFEKLDAIRNRLLDAPRLLIATTSEGAALLSARSPNMWSWIAARCLQYSTSEGRMDTEKRLESMREHHRMTDEEVVRLAQSGTVPLDPSLIEWLILIGRGDLVGP